MRDVSAQTRILIERILAVVTGVMGTVTIFWRNWIEIIFHADPDHGNGSLEGLIIVALLVVCVAFYSISRLEVRRLAAASSNP